MKNYRIFILTLFLLVILSIGFASAADDNLTVSDNQTLQSSDFDEILSDSDSQEDGELFKDEDNGTYLNPTKAYESLNEFRTGEAAWFWAPNNVNIVYFNTNDANQLKPLIIDPELEKTAQIRAKECSQKFAHERPDGTMCFDIYPSYYSLGENIAEASTGKQATEAWKEEFDVFDDQGHRRNMLNGDFQYVGIAGYRDSNGYTYWVQAFGGPYIPPTYFDDKTQRNESKLTLADLNRSIANNIHIELDNDYEYFNDSALSNGIIINKSVTIDGNGHSIDAKRFARIFSITADDVVIKNVRFLNAYLDYIHGGAILSDAFNVTLINCSFTGGFAYYGAGVASTNGSLSLIDCSFEDNLAVEGAFYAENTQFNLTNCSFKNNFAILYGAGACLNYGFGNLTNCTFSDNGAGRRGGAVSSIGSNITDANSIFTKNYACLVAGAVYLENSQADFKKSNFENNTIVSQIYSWGGAIYSKNVTTSFNQCKFNENRLKPSYYYVMGGALCLEDGNTTIYDCDFTNNSAMSNGGAVCLINNNALIVESRFVNNIGNSGGSVSNGGAIFSDRGNLTIEKSDFNNNTASFGGAVYLKKSTIEVSDDTFTHNNGTLHGGSIFAVDANATVKDSIFSDSYSLVGGGAFSLTNGKAIVENTDFINGTTHFGGAIHLENADGNVKNCNFINNTINSESAADGSALHLRNGNMLVENCHFENNTAYSRDYFTRGGAIFCEDGNVTFKDCEFKRFVVERGIIFSNRANVSAEQCSFEDSALGYDGVFYITDSHAIISKCSFSNISSDMAGALYLINGDASISDSTFSNMTTRFDGTSIYSWCGNITVSNCDFTDNLIGNNSSKNGGAIFANNAHVLIVASNFTNCHADSFGGAVYLSNCYGSVEQSRFIKNSINSINYYVFAGAIYSISGNMSISDCVFDGNSLNTTYYAQGGAITLRDGNYSISNCIFNNNFVNSSYQYGGAIYSENAIVSITNANFFNNTANNGGAVSVNNGNIFISDSDFTNNSATNEGGSISLDTSNSTIDSCNFKNSHANYGGAIESYSGNLTVTQSSFTNNSAIHGGAIYSFWGNATAIESNFTNNTADWDGGALYYCNAIDSIFTDNVANTAGAIYGDNNNATNCKFIRNVAYADNPTHNVTNTGCTYIDNRQITKVVIDLPYLENTFYIGDNLYIRVYTSYYPYEIINNATITMRVYKNDILTETFNFSSSDMGWTVNLTKGIYFAEFSIENQDFEAKPVNITFTVAEKEIAKLNVTISNSSYMSPVDLSIQSSVNAYLDVYLDDNYLDYFEVSANVGILPSYYNIAAGSHVLKFVLIPTDSKIDSVTVIKDFTVNKKETSIELDIESVTYPGEVIAHVKASEYGNVVLKIGNNTWEAYLLANETTSIYAGVLNSGNYTAEATFAVNENYQNSTASKAFTVHKLQRSVSIDVENVTYPSNVVVGIEASESGYVDVNVGDVTQNVYVNANVKTYIGFGALDNGVYNVSAKFGADENCADDYETKTLTVFKKQTSIILDAENTTTGESFVVYLKSSENGNVVVKVANLTSELYIYANEQTPIDFGKLENGVYDVSVQFSAGENYITSNATKTIRISSKITQDSIKISNGKSDSIIVNLPPDATGTVTLTINGESYNVDIVDGVAEVNLSDLTKGKYSYTITYSGDDKYDGFDMSGDINTASSDENPTIKPDIVIPLINDGGQVQLPVDATGTVKLTIDGNDYVFDVIDGVANIELPKLANGAYSYTITYSGDGKYSSFAQTSYLEVDRPIVISVSNLKATYSAGAYCQITVKNDLGIAADGVAVVITQNGKPFKTLTTKDGICKFKITQTPGTYKLVITSQSKSLSKTLTVKHLLSLKKVTVKKSAKKLVLTATLAKVNKKYLKNKKITFKFNGKKYTAKTNKKGVAKVTVKNTVLKKLKVGKKITYQATYLKDTVKYSVKVKK